MVVWLKSYHISFMQALAKAPGGYSYEVRIGVGLKPWPYLGMNQTKIDTLSKAQIWKMTPYARERNVAWRSKQRLTARKKHNLFKIALVIP